jgi:hypothetical protein
LRRAVGRDSGKSGSLPGLPLESIQ